MFGDLFEEDYSSVSNNQYGKGKKLKNKALEPPAPREFTNLSGIRNQGGTCYLNSLLQTLHFTPEFREALFSLGPEELGFLEDKDKPDAKVRIIPLQLQRLFAQLLLLDQEAASTVELTNSFGWTSDEEMRQHDVQELNRILFSALETSLVGTSGHDLINRLYHGTIVNQVVCNECKNISEKQEDFLDLTVAVKNVSGLEDALWNMYVEEEVFDYDNLYHCGTCDRLVKAAKSAKLRKLPPFLTVSLLRFNFDFVKCERYKETSSYTFPLRINLKPFCEQSELDDLEYIYDLFSVIIHKGGCYGGHYHVYIKDVDHLGNWQFKQEERKPDVNLKTLQNEEEIDDPLVILQAVILQEENNLISVDQLGQKLLKKMGISWNKKYRKYHGPLRKLLEFWEGDMVLSVAKHVPAGLHIYQTLDGDELSLCEIDIADGEDIFVWNGMEVGGVQIETGIDCEPLLLNILHLESSGEGKKRGRLIESPHVFPANAEVGTVFTAAAIPAGIILVNSAGSADEESWTAVPEEDMKKTFREQGLRNGSSILVQPPNSEDRSVLPKEGKWMNGMNEIDWIQVKNLCQLESEEKQVKISATVHTVVFDIRIKAIKELKLMKELAENSCLRPIDRNGKLLCPVPDGSTLKEAEVKMGSSLGLCLGKAPTSSQLFLFFAWGTNIQPGTEMEVIVEETLSVKECLKIMLEKSCLPGDAWHLRKMDWCYEAGEPLCGEDATLQELRICSGDTLLLIEGKLPLPGFLKVPIWWYRPRGHSGHWESQDQPCTSSQGNGWRAASTQGAPGHVPAEVSLVYLGDLDISEDAALVDLKSQARALTPSSELAVPAPALLRAWTVESRRPGRLLRTDRQRLKEYKLGRRPEICLEPLQEEEQLGPQDVLLRTQMRIPEERAYAPAVDLVWDTSRGWTTGSLRQRVADFYSLPVEKIEIAKYFPEKFEWLPISSWNQQITKRKKKKKQDTLQGAPYYLKDGDTIGVKNLLVDDSDDFSTARDDAEKEKQELLPRGKRDSQEVLCAQNSDVSSAGTPARPRGPEASLSIHVGSFR
ncbi:ubiquitin carboxyl-terminal hydrolase 40 isoform X5 [Ictidomys tridecemlineatus]|uniref:ubiquitin carboxyl-terminal hydrolase 40 isoform X3 n=1 Tax=Ictidomys tridecemlineatus TaxID=43179 RepID=UPI0006814270|nr:ubiquitin carboxyl-terminal hydrolase 40 isoform X3 [Ictidomys tridecemlineatus]KAG3275562.1 ubiquitin specific peptidase 40, transcript variant X9 [Ictidomys tridecemlineatus]